MITTLIGIASLFAAGSTLPASPSPLAAREITPASLTPPGCRTAGQGRPTSRLHGHGRRCGSNCSGACAPLPPEGSAPPAR